MKPGRMLTLIGVVLIVSAWVFASGIPKAAHNDFDTFVRTGGGRTSLAQGVPDAYRRMSAYCRMLQSFYVGSAGLICLAIGLGDRGRRA